MAAVIRKNFSASADGEVLAALQQVARSQGRPVEALMEEDCASTSSASKAVVSVRM